VGGKTVWLVGMMGAGKSSVGARLAERLGVPFYDTDTEVELEAGLSVAEIFAREGEEGFRAREGRAVERLAGRAAVVALGGGALTRAAVRERVAEAGRRVYLRARAETLLARIGAGRGRPLLCGLDAAGRLGRLRELLARREPDYARAEVVVETDASDLPEVVEAALRALAAV
jgi:shikimate kinase